MRGRGLKDWLIQSCNAQSMLYNTDPTLEGLSAKEEEKWDDVRGRANYAGMLITNQLKGALDMMTEYAYPGQKGQHPEFGEEILKLAGEMCRFDEEEEREEGGGKGEKRKQKKKKSNKKK